MTETVVYVTTLDQWRSVLDIWFKQGFSWPEDGQSYNQEYFTRGQRVLLLDKDNDILIPTPGKREPISYQEFMANQKQDHQMAMTSDLVYKPSHYQLEDGTQVKDHITSLTAHMSGVRAWATGNAIKYLARAGRKDDMVKDLKKAQENIQIIIDDAEKWGRDK